MYYDIIWAIMTTSISILAIWEIVDRVRKVIKDSKDKAFWRGYKAALEENNELPF